MLSDDNNIYLLNLIMIRFTQSFILRYNYNQE